MVIEYTIDHKRSRMRSKIHPGLLTHFILKRFAAGIPASSFYMRTWKSDYFYIPQTDISDPYNLSNFPFLTYSWSMFNILSQGALYNHNSVNMIQETFEIKYTFLFYILHSNSIYYYVIYIAIYYGYIILCNNYLFTCPRSPQR